MYESTKIIDGFSTTFRQWKANSHCKYIHGYSLSFKLTFKSETLNEYNWVQDFGFSKSKDFTLKVMDLFKDCNFKLYNPTDRNDKLTMEGCSLEIFNPSYISNLYTIKGFFDYLFDHTTIIAKDDPNLSEFISLNEKKLIQLRILEYVGCEKFSEFIFEKLKPILPNLYSVECRENDKNTAIYFGKDKENDYSFPKLDFDF